MAGGINNNNFTPEMQTIGLTTESPSDLISPFGEDKPVDLIPFTTGQTGPGTASTHRRALMLDYSLGDRSPGYDQLVQDSYNGTEGSTRAYMAATENRKLHAETENILSRLLAEGGPPEDVRALLEATTAPAQTYVPETVYERVAGEKVAQVTTLAGVAEGGRNLLQDSGEDDETYDIMDGIANNVAYGISAQELLNRAEEDYKQQSWTGWAVDIAKTLVPGYTNYKYHNLTNSDWDSSWLVGDNLNETVSYLYSLPLEDFKTESTRIYEGLYADNPAFARDFASHLSGYATVSNFSTYVDIASVVPVGKVASLSKSAGKGLKGLSKVDDAKEALRARGRAVSKVASDPQATVVDANVATGATNLAAKESAAQKVRKRIQDLSEMTEGGTGIRAADITDEAANVISSLPSVLNPRSFADGKSRVLINNAANRFGEVLEETTIKLFQGLFDVSTVERITSPQAIKGMMDAAEASFRKGYNELGDGILDAVYIPKQGAFGGVDEVAIQIGNPKTGTPFATASEAEVVAKASRLDPKLYTIEEAHGNFVIQVRKGVDEDAAWDFRVSQDETVDGGLRKTFFHYMGASRNYTSSATSNKNRLTVNRSIPVFERHIQEAVEPLTKLTSDESDSLAKALDYNQSMKRRVHKADGTIETFEGDYFRNASEMEMWYEDNIGRLPSPSELAAYQTYVQLNNIEWVAQNISALSKKKQLGMEKKFISTTVTNPDGTKVRFESKAIEGRTVDKLPDRGGKTVYSVGFLSGEGVAKTGLSNNKQFMKTVEEGLATGKYQIIQPENVLDESITKMLDAGGEPIEYLIVSNVRSEALDPITIPYHGGGHTRYVDDNFLVQEGVRTSRYGRKINYGDKTLMAVSRKYTEDAKGFENAMNAIGKAIVDGADDTVLGNLIHGKVPFSVEDVKRIFSKDGGGFDPSKPFFIRGPDTGHLRPKGSEDVYQISEMGTRAQTGNKWAQERNNDLMTVYNTGTDNNPVYNIRKAQRLSAKESLSQTSKEIANHRFLEDFKRAESLNWAAQAENYLDIPTADLRRRPLDAIRNPVWRKDTPPEVQRALEIARKNLVNFLSLRSDHDKVYDLGIARTLRDMGNKAGDNAFGTRLLSAAEWTAKTDPAGLIRSINFSRVMGFWNPTQLVTQGQGIFMTAAIDGSPTRAIKANGLAMVMQVRDNVLYNGGALDKIDGMHKLFSMSKGEFQEVYQLLRKTGVLDVGLNTAYVNDDLVKGVTAGGESLASKAWKSNTLPYRLGETQNQSVAVLTSYLRWKELNPTAKLDNAAINSIRQRADDLTFNMTSASRNTNFSSSTFLSLLTQWSEFHMRVQEAMLSTKFTRTERARLLGFTAALYGAPAGAGLAAGGYLPMGDLLRETAYELGWDGESDMGRFLNVGFLGILADARTGDRTTFSQRYGPNGNSLFWDMLADGGITNAFGPSGKAISTAFKDMSPVIGDMIDIFNPYSESPGGGVIASDAVRAARTISSINNVYGGYAAWNLGQLWSKSGELLDDDISSKEALNILFGMVPQSVLDGYTKGNITRKETEARNAIKKEAQRSFNRYVVELQQKNYEQAEQHKRKAMAFLKAGGYNEYEMNQIYTEFTSGDTRDRIDQVDRRWYEDARRGYGNKARMEQIERQKRLDLDN